jgi:hypothetical protein
MEEGTFVRVIRYNLGDISLSEVYTLKILALY